MEAREKKDDEELQSLSLCWVQQTSEEVRIFLFAFLIITYTSVFAAVLSSHLATALGDY